MTYYINKKCKQCKKEFSTKIGKKIFCSYNCGRKYRKIFRKTHPEHSTYIKVGKKTMDCKTCSKSFSTNNPNQKWCSKECSDFATKLKRRKKKAAYYGDIPNFNILKRDNFSCIYCGKSSIENGIKLQIDHLIPKDKGGKNEINNLVTACPDCNVQKGIMILNDIILIRIKKEIKRRNIRDGYILA